MRIKFFQTAALTLLWLACQGCSTFGAFKSGPLAQITIWNSSLDEVESATRAVFADNGYIRMPGPPFTFERPGSTEANVAYGSLLFKRDVTERVKVSVEPRGTSIVISCTAALVEAAGDNTFEDSHKVTRSEPYDQMLKQVSSRLKSSP